MPFDWMFSDAPLAFALSVVAIERDPTGVKPNSIVFHAPAAIANPIFISSRPIRWN